MRLFFISLVIALASLSPEIAELQDWEIPGVLRMLVAAPHAGFGYMKVLFHELGHTAAMWSYGQPAVPVFNFADGGGFAQPLMGRSIILQVLVYAGMAYGCWLLFMHWQYAALGLAAAFIALHLCFATDERYHWVVSYMGNGGAVLAGFYCIWRAACGKTYSAHSPTAEKYVNMIFGIFAVLHGILLAWSLATNDLARDVYNQGIGGHITNDFTSLADQLDTRIENVARFHGAFIALWLIVTAVAVFLHHHQQKHDNGVTPAP